MSKEELEKWLVELEQSIEADSKYFSNQLLTMQKHYRRLVWIWFFFGLFWFVCFLISVLAH